MTRDTFIKHKEDAMICEENGLIIANYNVWVTQQKSKPVAQAIVHYIMAK